MRSGESMVSSVICSPSRPFDAANPPGFWLDHGPGRAAFGLAQRRRQRGRKALSFGRREETRDWQFSSARHEVEVQQSELLVGVAHELRPAWIERPFGDLPAMADAPHAKL